MFSISAFSVTPVLTRTNRILEVARTVTKHSKCCDKFSLLAVSFTLLFRCFVSSYYTVQYTLLKSFTVSSALLTKLPKKFHTKLLASFFIFTKLFTKTLLLWRCRVSFDINLATYSWFTTWREHVTKTAPARRRHAVGGGGGTQLYSNWYMINVLTTYSHVRTYILLCILIKINHACFDVGAVT